MPITTKDVYFGEGIYSSGDADPRRALETHRNHIRVQRLNDLLTKESRLDNDAIAKKFDEIAIAIEAADTQVEKDNAAFIKKHKLVTEE